MTARTSKPATQLNIRISNDFEAIAFARTISRQALPNLDSSLEPLYFGALTEVITNAIEEHSRVGSGAEVLVTVFTGRRPSITVSDSGAGFDPEAHLVSKPGSGLGLLISRSVVLGLKILSGPSGTTVTLPYPASAL